jgi:glycine/D-amino acid oxidase-like deaminating enzyme
MSSLWLDNAAVTTDDPALVLGEDASYDDVVVGAGLAGLVTALLLARSGRRVVVLEAHTVGAGATGNTTGKVSLLQGTKLSRLTSLTSDRVARAYLEANREGQSWLLRFCDDHGIDYQRRDAITYAPDNDAIRSARKEYDAAGRLGLDVRWSDDLDAPFPISGGVVLADQAQIDPMLVLAALAAQVREHGGRIVEGVRVVGATYGRHPKVRLDGGGTVQGETIVLATGSPILDRGLTFAKMEAQRSYALAFEHPDPPTAMFLSSSSPTTSVRDAVLPDGSRLLLTGGFGHPVGRVDSEVKQVAALRAWSHRYFPDVRETHAWAAQDYTTHDTVPYVGKLPRGAGRIYALSGFDKWGMTNAVAGALEVTSQILGGQLPWASTLGHRVTRPQGAARMVTMNAKTGLAATEGIVSAVADLVRPTKKPADQPDEGDCALLHVCTHLGGRLHWNGAEQSWDCPLHGSRFDTAGEVIEGPATRALLRRNRQTDGGAR